MDESRNSPQARDSLSNVAKWNPSSTRKSLQKNAEYHSTIRNYSEKESSPESIWKEEETGSTLTRIPSQENITETDPDDKSIHGMAYFLRRIRENPQSYSNADINSNSSATSIGGSSPVNDTAYPRRAPFHQQLAARSQEAKSNRPRPSKVSTAQETAIEWTDVTSGSIGQFFVNTVILNEDRVWVPENLNKHTICTYFEEVAQCEDVVQAYIVNDRPFADMMNYLFKFPAHCQLYTICPSVHRKADPERTITICPSFSEHLFENGDFGCDLETCLSARKVTINETWNEFETKCNFMILRYVDKVRLIIFSGSLNDISWTKTQQFGWYHDFPISDQASEVVTQFEKDLRLLITSLQGGNVCDILRGVDFSMISPHLHLITCIKGEHLEVKNEFSSRKVSALRELCTQFKLSWRPKENSFQNFCQTTKFGKGKAVLMLERLMELNPSIDSRRAPLKIVFPSAEHVTKCVEVTEGLTEDDVAALFQNNDATHVASPYLHDPDCHIPVIPHANIYRSAQLIGEEERCYGYLMTGSHVLGYGSWGDKESSPDYYNCVRFELSLAIFPYTDANGVHHAVDLSHIDLPWDQANIQRYRTPAYRPNYVKPVLDTSLPVYIGTAKRYLTKGQVKKAVFLDPLHSDHPLLQKFPAFPTRDSCMMHEETVKDFDPELDLPELESVVEFRGKLTKPAQVRRGRRTEFFRAESLVKIHESLSKATEAYGLQEMEDKESTNEEEWSTYIGVVDRSLHNQAVFIEPLPSTSTLAEKYMVYPENTSAYLHSDIVQAYDQQASMPCNGAVVEFKGSVKRRGKKNNRKEYDLRVCKILQLFTSIDEAAEHYGVDSSEFRVAPVMSTFTKRWEDMTPAEQMASKGIETDEDFDNYWRKRLPKLPEDPEKKRRLEAVNTKPMPIEDDMAWLERYARAKAHGRLPKILMGPFNIHVMQMAVEASRRQFLQGSGKSENSEE